MNPRKAQNAFMIAGLLTLSSLTAFPRAHAAPDCKLGFDIGNVAVTWTGQKVTQAVTFNVTKGAGGACSFNVGLDAGSGGSYTGRVMRTSEGTISYQIYKDSALTQVVRDIQSGGSSSNMISGSLSSNATQTSVTYYIVTPVANSELDGIKHDGSYTDTFTARLYQSPDTSPVASRGVTLTTQVAQKVDLSFSSAGTGFDPTQTSRVVSFGDLSSSGAQSFNMVVRSNVNYQVYFSSQNNGALKHVNPAMATTVPYVLQVGASTISLGSSGATPVVVASGSGANSLSGTTHAVTATPGSVSQRMAGQYSDVITVTVMSTE